MSKKFIGMILGAVLIVVGFCTTANAAAEWATATVTRAGTAGDIGVYFYIQNNTTLVTKVFLGRVGQENRQLAVALTAITNGFTVYVNADFAAPSGTTRLNAIYLNSN